MDKLLDIQEKNCIRLRKNECTICIENKIKLYIPLCSKPITQYEDGTLKVHMGVRQYVKIKKDKILISKDSSHEVISHNIPIEIYDTPITHVQRIHPTLSLDCIRHIIGYMGQTGRNEHTILMEICNDPIGQIISTIEKEEESSFSPPMAYLYMDKRSLEEWSQICNSMFISFLSQRPNTVSYILQQFRIKEKLDDPLEYTISRMNEEKIP